jgi:hypothetical protein
MLVSLGFIFACQLSQDTNEEIDALLGDELIRGR